MATGVIDTNGVSDSVLYSQIMSGLTTAYNNYGTGAGNYPNVQDILTDRILEKIWMRNILNARIFADGMGITSRTGVVGCSSVRVPLMAPPRYSMRTISIAASATQSIPGTPGNSGLENVNLPQQVSTNGVDVYLNQLYDDATVFYKLSQDMVTLPIAAEYTAMIPETVANMEDSTILATHMLAGLARAAETSNSNIVPVNLSTTTNGYLQQILNQLVSKMTNPQTSWSEGVVKYPLNTCVIVMRQSFWDLLFSVNNGVLLGCNLAQEMLVGGGLTKDGKRVGDATFGIYSSVWIKVVPDSFFNQAAALMGINGASQYAQFSKVQAYIASGVGFAFGRATADMNTLPNPGNAIGTKLQNLFRWGAANTRGSAIGMIISTENNLADFTNPVTGNGKIVAPESFDDTIKSYGVTNVDYGTAKKIGVYASNTTTTVTLTVTNSDSDPVTDAALSVVSGGKAVGYTNNADGTYTIILARGAEADVTINANGYQQATVNISTTNTANATYATSSQLTNAA